MRVESEDEYGDGHNSVVDERSPAVAQQLRQELSRSSRVVVDLEVEDTPFIIARAEIGGKEKNDESVSIYLTDDTYEKLDPRTLKVGKDNVLYCLIKGNRFTARFSRPAYYQIAAHIKKEGDKFYLPLNNKKYFL